MIKFKATIESTTNTAEKLGWKFVVVSKTHAEKLNPGVRTSYRVKGRVDSYELKKKALIPMSEGRFLVTLDTKIRKAIGKKVGDVVTVELELDKAPLKISPDLIACLQDEPMAYEHFKSMPPSHQRYFSNWIDQAKTPHTKAKRLTMCVMAMARKMDFGQMIREGQGKNS